MCLAIFKPFGQVIDIEKLKNGFHNNDDGAGFSVSNGEKIVGFKGYFTFAEFMEKYDNYNKPEYATAVHFRMATHGAKNKDNCHPFRLSRDWMAIHNGILPWKSDAAHSDTYYFCKEVLRPLCKNGRITDPKVLSILEDHIDYNKIVIMNKNGTAIILNENSGHWKEGIWYSNSGYEERTWTSWNYHDDDYGYRYSTNACGYKKEDLVVVGNGTSASDAEIEAWMNSDASTAGLGQYDWDNDPEILEFERKYEEKYGAKARQGAHTQVTHVESVVD